MGAMGMLRRLLGGRGRDGAPDAEAPIEPAVPPSPGGGMPPIMPVPDVEPEAGTPKREPTPD